MWSKHQIGYLLWVYWVCVRPKHDGGPTLRMRSCSAQISPVHYQAHCVMLHSIRYMILLCVLQPLTASYVREAPSIQVDKSGTVIGKIVE